MQKMVGSYHRGTCRVYTLQLSSCPLARRDKLVRTIEVDCKQHCFLQHRSLTMASTPAFCRLPAVTLDWNSCHRTNQHCQQFPCPYLSFQRTWFIKPDKLPASASIHRWLCVVSLLHVVSETTAAVAWIRAVWPSQVQTLRTCHAWPDPYLSGLVCWPHFSFHHLQNRCLTRKSARTLIRLRSNCKAASQRKWLRSIWQLQPSCPWFDLHAANTYQSSQLIRFCRIAPAVSLGSCSGSTSWSLLVLFGLQAMLLLSTNAELLTHQNYKRQWYRNRPTCTLRYVQTMVPNHPKPSELGPLQCPWL